jgi:hypothetical protein
MINCLVNIGITRGALGARKGLIMPKDDGKFFLAWGVQLAKGTIAMNTLQFETLEEKKETKRRLLAGDTDVFFCSHDSEMAIATNPKNVYTCFETMLFRKLFPDFCEEI